MKKLWIIVCLLAGSIGGFAQMNNPYVDDKIVHFGFSLGVNFMAYQVTDSEIPIDGKVYHARTNSMIPGFSVGFITDLRISPHLNFRFLPNLKFGQKIVTYTTGEDPASTTKSEILSLPLALPLVLKWSADREKNYRPYLMAGGGVDFNLNRPKANPLCPQLFDAFVTFGFGCDFYMQWFKLCPEISYQVGFMNALTPIEERASEYAEAPYFVNAINRLRNQQITLTFNFE